MEVKFTYNPNTHVTTCIRKTKHKTYIGYAKCAAKDFDFESKLMGEHYAYTRSLIAEKREIRKKLVSEIEGLQALYNLYNKDPKVDINSRECRILYNEIANRKIMLSDLRNWISATYIDLHTTIATKDNYYNKIRSNRKREGKK